MDGFGKGVYGRFADVANETDIAAITHMVLATHKPITVRNFRYFASMETSRGKAAEPAGLIELESPTLMPRGLSILCMLST